MVETNSFRSTTVVFIIWLAFSSFTALTVDAYVILNSQEFLQPRTVVDLSNTPDTDQLTHWGLTNPDLISTYFYNPPYENKLIENNKNNAQIESGLFGQPIWDSFNYRETLFRNLIPPPQTKTERQKENEEEIIGDQSGDNNDPLGLIDHITGLIGQNSYYYNLAQPIVIKLTEISGLEPVKSIDELFMSTPTSTPATTTTTITQTTNNPMSSQNSHPSTGSLSTISISNLTNANLTELKLFKTSHRLNRTNSTSRNETTKIKLKSDAKSSKIHSGSLPNGMHKNLKNYRPKLSSTATAAGFSAKSDHSFLDDLENDSGVGKLSNERLIHKRVSSSDSPGTVNGR